MIEFDLASIDRWLPDVPCMDIVYISDSHSCKCKAAILEVESICNNIPGAVFHCIEFQRLDSDETEAANIFYNADVAIVDMSVQSQQHSLSYHLGIRESYGMKQNTSIILYYRDSATDPLPAKSFLRYTVVVYHVIDNVECIVDQTSDCSKNSSDQDLWNTSPSTLGNKIQFLLMDLKAKTKDYMYIKEKFLTDLSKAKEKNSGKKLHKILHILRMKLHNTGLVSADTVYNMLLSFREIQDYSEMIELVDELKVQPGWKDTCTPQIDHLYAFALNRRNQEGDRQLAEEFVQRVLEKKEYHFLEMFCLCGRIYKDKFIDSLYSDKDSLDKAILWYRKGFEMEENEFAGVNLATLLMIKGNNLSNCKELHNIFIVLNNTIGRKGNLETLKNYWDVATYFEISILSKDYSKANIAAACMFNLKPPNWCLKSTISNIQLITKLLWKTNEDKSPEEIILNFWMEFFTEASSEKKTGFCRLPILIKDSPNSHLPSYVTLKNEADDVSIHISNLCIETLRGKCSKTHEFLYNKDSIKSISFYKEDQCSLYFYIHKNSVDVQAIFPSNHLSKTFHEQILQMMM